MAQSWEHVLIEEQDTQTGSPIFNAENSFCDWVAR